MRKGLLVLVLLACPAVGFGQTLDLGLLGGPVNFNWQTDTEITFSLYLQNAEPLDGLQWLLAFEQEAQNALWTVSNVDATDNATGAARLAYGYGQVPAGTSLADVWDVEGQAEIWFRDSGQTAPGTYYMAAVTIKPLVSMEPYDTQVFSLGVDTDNTDAVMNADGGTIGTYQALQINIVPEPASALLLLLAAPFIRRRTA